MQASLQLALADAAPAPKSLSQDSLFDDESSGAGGGASDDSDDDVPLRLLVQLPGFLDAQDAPPRPHGRGER